MTKKILLLGSGELGKELTISLKRLGQYVIACDRYDGAPAMQVADESCTLDMLSGDELDRVVERYKPDLIVPEIEAIATARFFEYERQGYTVIPSARAANATMNRRTIRDLAARELGIRTAPYAYATTEQEFLAAVQRIGLPCVTKPIMSSSGKGQSTIRTEAEILPAWKYAIEGGRTHVADVIVEGFIEFESEITLLTVTQWNGQTITCPPIGHRQEHGDYRESWQPAVVREDQLEEAKSIAKRVTTSLTGAGIWGVEFFLAKDAVYFSELSPRPHDTGMVTLGGTQTFSEFELHARAILGLPIPEVQLERVGASAVILATKNSDTPPRYKGVAASLSQLHTDIRIFGKPVTRVNRRMGVALSYDVVGSSTDAVREVARHVASQVTVE